MIVCKFGGSSVSHYDAVCKVKEILLSNKQRKIAVISAMGKSPNSNIKLTDILIALSQETKSCNFERLYLQFYLRCKDYSEKFKINANEIIDFEKLKLDIKNGLSKNFIVSLGEFFTAKVCAIFFNWLFCPIEKIIISENGKINLNKSKENFLSFYNGNNIVVPGFYVGNKRGEIVLLERGGSDTTGAILSNITNANLYEKFTDVNGLYPYNFDNLNIDQIVTSLSYGQLTSISSNGFQPFSKKAIKFLSQKNINCEIKKCELNSNLKTVLGKKSNQYFFKNSNLYYIFKQVKKVKKYHFISSIFKTFMFDKIKIDDAVFCNKKLYVKASNPFNNNKVIVVTELFLFGNKYCKLKKQICNYLKKSKLDFHITDLSLYGDKIIIKIFGITKSDIQKNLINILEKR